MALWVPGSQGVGIGSVPARVVASPLYAELAVAEARLGPHRTARATAALTNLGAVSLRDVTLELRSDPRLVRVAPRNPFRYERLGPQSGVRADWSICARGPGTYVLVAVGRGSLPSGARVATESEARVLVVTASRDCW
jgi:hypothetical protein